MDLKVDAESRLLHQSFSLIDGCIVRTLSLGERAYSSRVPASSETAVASSWWQKYMRGAVPIAEEKVGKTLTSIDLFSGTGGLTSGLRQACTELGFNLRSLCAVDQDVDATEVHSNNHATEERITKSVSELVDYQIRGIRDAARFTYAPDLLDSKLLALIGSVDVVLAGPPCQGHSNLNNQSRRTDRRNELYLTVPAIAIALQARMVVIENVPAVIHDEDGVIDVTTALFNEAGYKVSVGVLRADYLGWPQTRERFFMVATLKGAPIGIGEVAQALAASPMSVSEALLDLKYHVHSGSFLDQPTNLSPDNKRRIDYLFNNDVYDLPNSERPDCHKDGTTYKAVYGRMYGDRPAPTLTTGFLTPGRGRFVHPFEPRVLTLREAARIQGFPSDFQFNTVSAPVPLRAKLVKWIGDAVPMPLGYAASLAVLLPERARTQSA